MTARVVIARPVNEHRDVIEQRLDLLVESHRHLSQPLLRDLPEFLGPILHGVPLRQQRIAAMLQLLPGRTDQVLRDNHPSDVARQPERPYEFPALNLGEEDDQRLQVSQVSRFQGVQVRTLAGASHHQRETNRLHQRKSGQRASHPSVAVLKRMDLRKAMVEPRCFDFRSNFSVVPMHFDQGVHFGRNLLRWTVLVYLARPPGWIVRHPLVGAPEQWDLHSVSELVPTLRYLLVLRQEGMEFLDVARRQWPLVLDEGEYVVYRRLVIADHGRNCFRRRAGPVGNQRRVDTVLDQDFGYASVEIVHPLDQAGLDRPFPAQLLVECRQCLGIREPVTLFLPDSGQGRELALFQ